MVAPIKIIALHAESCGTTTAFGLNWRTLDRAVRAEHATVSGLGSQHRVATFAFVEMHARVRRHRLRFLMAAVRAGDDRLQLDARATRSDLPLRDDVTNRCNRQPRQSRVDERNVIARVESEEDNRRACQSNAQRPGPPMLAKRKHAAAGGDERKDLNRVIRVTTPRLQCAQSKGRPDRRQQRKAARRSPRREQRADCSECVQSRQSSRTLHFR